METLQYTDAKSIGLPTITANIPNFVANNAENSLYFIGNDTESNNHTNKTVSLIFTRLPTSPGFVHVLCCQTCNFSTLSLAAIKEHIKTQHPSVDSFTTYSCAVCFASSTERALLEEHIGIYHPTLENVPQKILEKCHIISGTDSLPTTALLSTSAGTIPLTLTQTPNANGGSPGLRLQLTSSSIPNHSTSARQIQSVPTYVTSQSPAPLSSSATATPVSQSEPISSAASVNGDSAPSSLSTDYPLPVLGSRRRKAAVPGKLPVVPSSTSSSGTIPDERDVSEVKRRKVESPLDPSDAVTTTAAATATATANATATTTTTIAASTAIKAEVPNSITKQAILAMVNSPTGPKLALIGATAGNTSQKLCDQTATAISGMLSTHSSSSIQTSAPSSSSYSGNPTVSTHALSVPLMGGSSIPCGLLFAAPNGHSLSNEGSATTGTYRAGGVLRLSDLFDAVKNSCAPQGPTTPTSTNEASEKTPPRSAASQVPTVSSLTLQYLAAPMMDVGNMTATTTATVACSSSSGAPSITDGLAAGKLLNQVFAAAALNPLVERQLSTSGEQALDMSIRSNCKSPESQGQQQQHSSPDITKAQSEQLTRESGDANSLDALRSALTAQIPASVAQTVPGEPPTAKAGTAETSSSSGPSSPPPSSTPNLLNLTTLGKQKMEIPCQQQQQQQTVLSQAQSTPVSARQTAHLLNLAPLQTLISALANASSGGGKVDTTNGPITTSSSPHFLPPPSSVSTPLVTIDGPLGATCPISFPTALASALMPPHVTTNSLKGVTLGEYIPVGSLISGQTTGGVFNSVALNAGAPNLISFVTGLGANNHSANAASAARFQHNLSAGSQSFGLGFGPAGDSATPIDFNAQQALLAAAAAAATAPGSAQDLQSGSTPLRLSTSTTTVATPMICALDPRNTLHLRVPESITVACSGFPTTVTATPVKGYRLESAASLDSSMREVPNALSLDEDRRTGDFEGSALLNVDTSQRNGSLDEGADDSDEMADESCAGATNSGASASAGGDGESPIPSNDPSSTSGQNRNRRTPGSRPSGGGRRSGLGGSRPHRQNFTPTQNRILTEWYSSHQYKPYPSTDDTKMLAHKSGLTYSQVKKWFANKRARTSTSGLPKPMPPTAPDTTADTSTAAAYVAAVKAAAAAAVSTPGIGAGSGLIALPPSSSSTSVSASQSSISPNCSVPTATVLSATNLMIRTPSHAAVNSFSGLTVLAPRPPSASCAYTLTVPTFVPETTSVEARKSDCDGAFLASTTGNHEDEEQISKEEGEEEEEDNNVLKNSPSPSLPSLAKVDQTAGEDTMVSPEGTGAVHSPKALVSSPQSHAEETADIGSPPALLVSSSPVPTTAPGNPETSPQRERDTPSHAAPSRGSD